jgi:N-acetylmuramic acid 6-phosphate etherase
MILIADGGSTKTDWRLIAGREILSMVTRGLNPYHTSEQEIQGELDSLDLRGEEDNIHEIYFYGSGVSNREMRDIIHRLLQTRIGTHPFIQVKDDLLGVARALFQDKSGIACILGTGSNSGLYKDGDILDKVPAMGYSLGDEGGGADIGKRLVNALHKRNISDALRQALIEGEGLSIDHILENVYNKPHANRYLASLAPIAAKYIDHREIREIVSAAFEDFIRKNISKYSEFSSLEIGFAGSIAYYFKEILTEVMERHHLKISLIVASPVDGLVTYHQRVRTTEANGSVSITESASRYDNLEQMSVRELLHNINKEDSTVHKAVYTIIPQIEKLVDGIISRLVKGGRLFYVGAGTSGRLGIVDASEIPPTFGVPFDIVIGIIAGGDRAIRKAVESAEDDIHGAWRDLAPYKPGKNDVVVGIAASGRTPYVIGAVRDAKKHGLLTACITNNPNTRLAESVDIPLEALVGPEFVTGSTRMKSGTSQKLILNMITTSTMIKLGRVKGNKMVDMQLTNAKLVERGSRMISEELGLNMEESKRLLLLHGSVRNALDRYSKQDDIKS